MPQCEDPAFGQEGTYATNHNLPVAAGLPSGKLFLTLILKIEVHVKFQTWSLRSIVTNLLGL